MPLTLSRRSFLQGTALTSAELIMAGALPAIAATSGEAKAASGPETASASGAKAARGDPAGSTLSGPQAVTLTVNVNDTARTLQAEPRMTLAEALRGPLGLTGTKIACNRGACSACTVWLDGAPVCSCMMLAVDVGTRRVTTIEGLAHGDTLHPVQQAFIEHDALQCGFCTPGMVMSCAALLGHTPNPTAADVKAAISGHYCRCGTYPHVVAATLAAAGARKE